MGCNNKGLHKTILPGATGQRTPAAQPTLSPTNYTPTFTMPFGNNGPQFPTAPGSWGFGPHAAAYQCTNNIPPPQLGTSMMVNTMEFNNWFKYILGPCLHLLHMVSLILVRVYIRTTSEGQGGSMAYMLHCLTSTPKYALSSTALLWTVNIDMDTIRAWAILDSGVTSHFLITAAPMTSMCPTSKPIISWLPNGERVHSTHTCTLNIPALPASVQHTHIILGLALHSLISVLALCNAGCNVVFIKIGCTITYRSIVILCGSKCTARTGLWMIPLCPTPPLTANNNQAKTLPTSHCHCGQCGCHLLDGWICTLRTPGPVLASGNHTYTGTQM
jgi:hypothetical protein